MKFIVDETLGKLAKWIRFLGYDTESCFQLDNPEIMVKAMDENRIILTREIDFAQNKNLNLQVVIIKFDNLKEQLLQLKQQLGVMVTPEQFMRCSICNSELKVVDRTFITGKVPPYIIKTKSKFKFCSTCNKVFWEGTHLGGIKKLIKEVFDA